MKQIFADKPYIAGLFIALIVLIIDQITKVIIVYDVMSPPRFIEVTSFFNLVMAWNKGVSFGMFGWDSHIKLVILTVMAFGAAIGLTIWMKREGRLAFAIPCGGIIGGAVGNGLDRLHWGAVADFLDFHVAGYHWPAFNVADMGISVGAIVLILESLLNRKDSSKNTVSE